MRNTELGVTAARRGIVARVHLAPHMPTRGDAIEMIAIWLFTQNAMWLSAMVRAGKRPPRRLLLAEPPWCTKPVRYVEHHGEKPHDRERDYFDGPTALHVGEATCIDIASYDAAAMYVLEHRDASAVNVRRWPSLHFVVEVDGRRFDTTTREGALQSLEEPWRSPSL